MEKKEEKEKKRQNQNLAGAIWKYRQAKKCLKLVSL